MNCGCFWFTLSHKSLGPPNLYLFLGWRISMDTGCADFFPLCSLLACPGFWLVFGLSYFGFTLLYFISFYYVYFPSFGSPFRLGCFFDFPFILFVSFFVLFLSLFLCVFLFCFCFLFLFLFLFISYFSLPMYFCCWRMYVVPVVPSTRAWHCVVVECITMHYLCVVACDHRADLSRVKNQYGHWVCWMSTSRRTV